MTKKKPRQCHLWQKENLASDDLDISKTFEVLLTFVEASHFDRLLLKCKQCGQRYFYEYLEEIDWKNGNDPQYSTFIPVESEKEAKEVAGKSSLELLQISPRLQWNWPVKKGRPEAWWVGK